MNIIRRIIANLKKIACLNRMDRDIHVLQEKFEKREQNIQQQIVALKEQISQCKKQNVDLKEQVSQCKQQNVNFKEQISQCKKQNADLSNELSLCKKENTDLRGTFFQEREAFEKNESSLAKRMIKVEKCIAEQTHEVFKNEQRNLRNHEKYSNAITEVRKMCNKMYPFVSEQIAQQEYEYNCSLTPENFEQELKDWFKRKMGEEADLIHPKTLNEKINWMKLHDTSEIKSKLSDKYAVRNWIAEKIGEQYLVPLIGVWDNFDDIDFNKFPNQFVLKCNHGSGMNIKVDNKEEFDISAARRKINKWLNTNYAYTAGLELHYKDIKPLIIAEEYLASDEELKDYKFLCFHGDPKYVWVDYDRYTNHTRDVFDTEWNLQPFVMEYPSSKKPCERPGNLEELLRITQILCEGFPFVRVDLYDVNGRVYFGEMTFTSANGVGAIQPEEYDRMLGDLIDLPVTK